MTSYRPASCQGYRRRGEVSSPSNELAFAEVGLDETRRALRAAVASPYSDPVGKGARCLPGDRTSQSPTVSPDHRELIPRAGLLPGLEACAGEPFLLAVGEPYLAQALWSFAHGMVILGLDRRFVDGSNLERIWLAGTEPVTTSRNSAGTPVTLPP